MARSLDDDRLRRLVAEVTREVAAEASGGSGPRAAETLARAELCASCAEEARRRGPRAVITTTGKNRRGIVAKIAQAIAEAGGDIVDIAQTLVSDYFTMIIVVDTAALEVPFADFKKRLTGAVAALGAECLVMHEEIVNALQRV
ncbi:MAG TPA: ACT domain-containing protein [Polyangia bacterium]|nr:ACT domain-containing protein [Polyangia bacterium]